MKEITRDEMLELREKYNREASILASKYAKKGSPTHDGCASFCYNDLPTWLLHTHRMKKDYKLYFHFKKTPDCSFKPAGFIICCHEHDGKIYLTKHKAGNCKCYEKRSEL